MIIHRADRAGPTARPTDLLPERPGAAVFGLATLGGFLVALDVSIANTLLPAIGDDFAGTSPAGLSWVITGYAIVFAAVLVPAGRLADRIGRRRMYVYGLVVFAVGSGLCGAAPDLAMLLAGRVIQGAGAAAVSPASLGLLLGATDAGRRSVYAARWTGAVGLGVCLGPLIGGSLAAAGTWRWAFFVNMPFVLLAVKAIPRVLAETPRQPGRGLPDPAAAVMLAVAAAAIIFGISNASSSGLESPATLASVGIGGMLAALFVRRCARADLPLLDLRLLARRRIAVSTIVMLLYAFGFFGLQLTFVQFLVDAWHLSLVQAGVALLPMGVVATTMTTWVGHLAGRIGFRIPLATGAACMSTGVALSAVLDDGARFSVGWVFLLALIGIGIGFCYPLLGAAAVAGLPAADLAAATAVNHCARQIGAALGVAVAVAILGPAAQPSVGRFHAAWLGSAVVLALAALVALAIASGQARAVSAPTRLARIPERASCRAA